MTRQPNEPNISEEETEFENTASGDQPKEVPNPPTDGVEKSSTEFKNTAKSAQSPVVSNSTTDGVEEASPTKITEDISDKIRANPKSTQTNNKQTENESNEADKGKSGQEAPT